jgi:hypothetical protein
MSKSLKGKIPIWRLTFWVLAAMIGVAYFAHPETQTQRYALWGFIVFVGVVMAGFGLMLNWTQTERARTWVREHPRTFRIVLVLAVLVSALLQFWNIIFHK